MWFMFGEIHFTRRHPAATNMDKQIFIYMIAISAMVYGAPPDIDKHHGSIEVIAKRPEKLIELVTEPTFVIYTRPPIIRIDPPKVITINNKDDVISDLTNVKSISKSSSSIEHAEVFVQKHINKQPLNNDKKSHNNEHVHEHLLRHNRDGRDIEHLSQLLSDRKKIHISQNNENVNEYAQHHSDIEKKHISHHEHHGHLEITQQSEKLIELVTEPTLVLVTRPPIIRTDPPRIITLNNKNDQKYIVSDLMNVESESKSSSSIKHKEVYVQKQIDQQNLNNETKSHHNEHVDDHLLHHTRDEAKKHISHDEHEREHLSQLHSDEKKKHISQNVEHEHKHVHLQGDIEKKHVSLHDEHVHEHTLLHSDGKKVHISHHDKHEHGNAHLESDDEKKHNSPHDNHKQEHLSHHHEHEHEHLSHQHEHGHDHLSHHHEHEHLAHHQEHQHLSEEKKHISHHPDHTNLQQQRKVLQGTDENEHEQQESQKVNKQVVGIKKQISDTQISENISSGSITKPDHQQQGEVKRNNVVQGTNEQEQQGSLNTKIEHVVPKQEVSKPTEHVVTVHKKVERKHEPVKKIIVEHTHTHQPAKMVPPHHDEYVPIKHEHKHHVVVHHDHDHTVSLKHEEHVPVYHHQKAYHHNEHHFDSHYHIDDDDDDEDNFSDDHYDYHSY